MLPTFPGVWLGVDFLEDCRPIVDQNQQEVRNLHILLSLNEDKTVPDDHLAEHTIVLKS